MFQQILSKFQFQFLETDEERQAVVNRHFYLMVALWFNALFLLGGSFSETLVVIHALCVASMVDMIKFCLKKEKEGLCLNFIASLVLAVVCLALSFGVIVITVSLLFSNIDWYGWFTVVPLMAYATYKWALLLKNKRA